MTHKTLKFVEEVDLSEIYLDSHIMSAAGRDYTNFSVKATTIIKADNTVSIQFELQVGSNIRKVTKVSDIKPTLIEMIHTAME